jgi:hypothetical protein
MERGIRARTGNQPAEVQFMDDKMEQIAVAAGKDPALADK